MAKSESVVINEIEKCAFDDVTDRQLFVLELSEPSEIDLTQLVARHFGCLIAWDANQSTVEEVSSLIDPLIKAGCVYFCCWGSGCERVHDIIDELDPYTDDVDGIIMTTWHTDQSLEEAIWFFLNVTWPDKRFEETFEALLGITVGSNEWASELRTALLEPHHFSKMVLDKEDVPKPTPGARHFVAMALLPAFAVSIPYAYLLLDESNRYDVPFWGLDLFVLLGAPFVGYGISGLLTWFFSPSLRNKPVIYWSSISVLGSFVTLAVILAYFYSLGHLYLGWNKTLWNAFLFASGLSLYASAFTATYFYIAVRRSKKNDLEFSVK